MAPLSEPERRDFWEICENRYQVRSTILTSQLPVSRWHEQIGDPVIRLFFDRLRIRDEGRFDAQESPKGELVSLGQQLGGAVDQQFATLRGCSPFMEHSAKIDEHLPGLCFALRRFRVLRQIVFAAYSVGAVPNEPCHRGSSDRCQPD